MSAAPPAPAPPVSPFVEHNQERLRRWASRGIYFGTSSWKYPGWQGLVYNRSYPSKKAFERECITEYSGVFPTVCADFALYDFPDAEQMRILHDTTADDFRLSLKVTDRITIKRYPNLPRHGANAGRENPDFLNVELFEDAFLRPVEALGKKRGVIIFEFSAFYPNSGVDLRDGSSGSWTIFSHVFRRVIRMPWRYGTGNTSRRIISPCSATGVWRMC